MPVRVDPDVPGALVYPPPSMDSLDVRPDLYRFLASVQASLQGASEPDRAVLAGLSAAREFLGGEASAFATLAPGAEAAQFRHTTPQEVAWDPELFTRFLRAQRIVHEPGVILARLARRGRWWGAIAVRREEAYDKSALQAFKLVAHEISETLQRMDREKVLRVRAKLDRKIIQQLAPKDLFFQILDGMRTLLAYDHSCALLTFDLGAGRLVVAAEQFAGPASRSPRIGREIAVSPDLAQSLVETAQVLGFRREGPAWREWEGREVDGLAALFDSHAPQADDGGMPPLPPERTMLVAPLNARGRTLGVLKVAGLHAESLGDYHASLLEDFAGIAAVAVQNAQRAESMGERMLEMERMNAVANVARYVSHDVNNHLGSTLLTVQQMRADLESGRFDPDQLVLDAQMVERALLSTRRIFGGMMRFARTGAGHVGGSDLKRALEVTLDVLSESFRQLGIEVSADVPAGLPGLPGHQGEIEQMLSNLLINAREAMPAGGTIRIAAAVGDGVVELQVVDTGCGIAPEHLALVQEPFYTTKSQGTGLGLPSCRSIVWSMGGSLEIDSAPGRGTIVRIRVPAAQS